MIEARVEIQKGSKYKYERYSDGLFLERVVNIPYPVQYGAFTDTLAPDTDELDCFIISNEPINQHAFCSVKILGAFICNDNGVSDDKLVCCLDGEPHTLSIRSYLKIKDFLENYKAGFKVIEFVDQNEAIKIYENSVKAFKEDADKL